MADISGLQDYFKKLQRALDSADFAFLNIRIVKKSKIDDLLVCTLALLPEEFKNAMNKKLQLDKYLSVSCYNRLSKLLKKPFILSGDYYMVSYREVNTLLNSIRHSLERDIRSMEEGK